ncbi:MAG: hypothetical protein WBR13_08915 [Allosphingosinicella sp.]
MIKANMKRLAISATFALGAALATAGPATAQFPEGREILYRSTYYSDSTYTEAVGHEENTCGSSGVGSTPVYGTWTPYVITEPWAYCTNGWLSIWVG